MKKGEKDVEERPESESKSRTKVEMNRKSKECKKGIKGEFDAVWVESQSCDWKEGWTNEDLRKMTAEWHTLRSENTIIGEREGNTSEAGNIQEKDCL